MYQSRCIVLTLCLVAGACNDGSVGESVRVDRHERPAPASPAPEVETTGSVGPVNYSFAPRRLTRTEIQVPVPLGVADPVWATKLIPAARTAALGDDVCRYAGSERLQMCTAEQEDGLALALLDRPIAHYRTALESRAAADQLRATALAGAAGFELADEQEGVRLSYGFFPAGERTFMVAQRVSAGSAIDPALLQVLESLHLPEPE
jgi:hypothetical protein